MRFLMIALMAVLSSYHLFAQQEKGLVLIAVKPSNSIIRLDTTLFLQQTRHIVMDTGAYVVRAWAPGRQLVVDTLLVTSRSPVLYRLNLPLSAEYKKYRAQRLVYSLQKSLVYVFAGVTAGSAIYYYSKYQDQFNQAGSYKRSAETNKIKYEESIDINEINVYRQGFERDRKLYAEAIAQSNKTGTEGIIIAASGAVVTGVLHFYYSRKLTRPVFNEMPLLSNISVNYQFTGVVPGPRLFYSYKF